MIIDYLCLTIVINRKFSKSNKLSELIDKIVTQNVDSIIYNEDLRNGFDPNKYTFSIFSNIMGYTLLGTRSDII